MKKSLIALAVLAASGAAMAQSSVTLYGVADAYVSSKKVVAVTVSPVDDTQLVVSKQRQTGVESGGLNSSRWGLKGSEDLGGGLNAIFTLESGFKIDNGAGSTDGLFDRQAFVGLASNSFGTVALGRQNSAYDGIRGSFFSAQGNSPAFDATNGVPFTQADFTAIADYDSAATKVTAAAAAPVWNKQFGRIGAWTGYAPRISNSISYTTPSFSGFKGSLVYGFGENKTATTSATKNVSANLSYTNGPVGVAVAHQNDEIVQGFHLKNTGIGGYYDLGVAKPFLSYNEAKYDGVAKQKEWAVGVRAPLGATTLVAQYAQSKGDDLGKNTSLGLSAEYSLSKRTLAYAAYNQTKAELADNNKNTVFGLGVRHSF